MAQIPLSQVADLSLAALTRHGAAAKIAQEMTRAIVWAEERGNRICGLYYLESYCQQLVSGRVDGQVAAQVSQPRPAEFVVDAMHGFAQPAFSAALQDAVAAAKSQGIARMGLFHAHTCTALGYFTYQLAEQGVLALGFTNASPIVAPPGGKSRVIGTNPMSFAVPAAEGGVAMMFDQSTTAVALGRVTMAKAAEQDIPLGWALDAQGNPTTDPGKAVVGSLASSGGYKGWGLGVMVELLAAGLCGGTLSKDVTPLKAVDGKPHDLSCFFILIDPGQQGFFDQLSALSMAVAADDGCRLPGQNKTLLTQVDVPDALWAQLQTLT